MRCATVLTGILLSAATLSAAAQTMSVTSSVSLPAPDSTAYDAGAGLPAAFTLMVTGCTGALGCRVSLENAGAASPVPIEMQWRLTVVSQAGGGALGCTALSPLLVWQDLPLAAVTLMDTAAITEPGTGCVAGIEVRAVNLSYTQHQHTSPPTTYWRDLLIRTVEK